MSSGYIEERCEGTKHTVPVVHRKRSDGILDEAEVAEYRRLGHALAFDPVQSGWVPAGCVDDLARVSVRPRDPGGYRFRAWRTSDAPDLARILSASALWRYLPESFVGPVDQAASAELIRLANASNHHLVRAVEFAGQVIGQVRLVFEEESRAEISYWLDEAVWGQGHGSRLVARFTRDCLSTRPDIARIFARVHVDNIASARVLERAGYHLVHSSTKDVWRTYQIDRHRPS